jgi:squalene-hopene/tetraprenyl-beta-curcumene cyclase
MRKSGIHKPVLLFSSLILLACGTLRAQDFAASWQGTLPTAEDQRRVVLQIARKDDNTLVATACNVEFLHDVPQIDSTTIEGSRVKVSMNRGEFLYEGTIAADGNSIAGIWTQTRTKNGTQDRQSSPLELRRATQQTAWSTPFQYQYHHKNVTYRRPTPDEPRIAFTPKLAVEYMEQGAEAWSADWKCVACHTNGSYMVVRPLLTPQLGQPNRELRTFFVNSLREQLAADEDSSQADHSVGPPEPTQVVYIAAGLAIWDAHVTHSLAPETAEALALMFKLQRSTGDWKIDDNNNPPLESNTFQLATVAARAIGNAPGWLARQAGTPVEAKVTLLENLLRSQAKVQGDYDRTDLLWAATELPGLLPADRMQQLVQMIFTHQHPDGGWSIRSFAQPEEWGKGNRAEKLRAEPEFPAPPSDGHMTGLAIIALRKAGVPASDPRIQRGVLWLLENQRASGRWYTRSLNRDGWQFITYSGTVYPLLALGLCNALPPKSEAAHVPLPVLSSPKSSGIAGR